MAGRDLQDPTYFSKHTHRELDNMKLVLTSKYWRGVKRKMAAELEKDPNGYMETMRKVTKTQESLLRSKIFVHRKQFSLFGRIEGVVEKRMFQIFRIMWMRMAKRLLDKAPVTQYFPKDRYQLGYWVYKYRPVVEDGYSSEEAEDSTNEEEDASDDDDDQT